MRRALLFVGMGLLAGLSSPAGAGIDGIWGVEKGEGANCQAFVMVLKDGSYQKAILGIGTTKGPRDTVVGTSRYQLTGDQVIVEPSLSLSRPEPRQTFLFDPASDTLHRKEPKPLLTFKRCPDRELNTKWR